MRDDKAVSLGTKFTPKQTKMLKALRIMLRVADRLIEKDRKKEQKQAV